MSFEFDLPSHHKSIIKVIGVGGGGGNAVNYMKSIGIRNVEFIICNTDIQALHSSSVKNQIQIGMELTKGLGAGANPTKGRDAALESSHEIREVLRNDGTKMLFITSLKDKYIKYLDKEIDNELVLRKPINYDHLDSKIKEIAPA